MNPSVLSPFWTDFFLLAGQALGVVCLWMVFLWLVHLWIRNAAIVDAGWAFGIAFCGAFFAWNGSGFLLRRQLLAAMVLLWGVRLGVHLFWNRILGHPEEGRYVELRRKWAPHIEWKFLAFYQVQAVSCVLLAIPFLLASLNPTEQISWLEWASCGIWLVGTFGVSLADRQLEKFKSDPVNRGQVCRKGLWAWSRHPNYFFEWLVWLSYGLFALGAPWGALGLIAPALILHFLLNVTGIPPTEEQSVRSRGDAYRKYQSEVSAFVPLPPRKGDRT